MDCLHDRRNLAPTPSKGKRGKSLGLTRQAASAVQGSLTTRPTPPMPALSSPPERTLRLVSANQLAAGRAHSQPTTKPTRRRKRLASLATRKRRATSQQRSAAPTPRPAPLPSRPASNPTASAANYAAEVAMHKASRPVSRPSRAPFAQRPERRLHGAPTTVRQALSWRRALRGSSVSTLGEAGDSGLQEEVEDALPSTPTSDLGAASLLANLTMTAGTGTLVSPSHSVLLTPTSVPPVEAQQSPTAEGKSTGEASSPSAAKLPSPHNTAFHLSPVSDHGNDGLASPQASWSGTKSPPPPSTSPHNTAFHLSPVSDHGGHGLASPQASWSGTLSPLPPSMSPLNTAFNLSSILTDGDSPLADMDLGSLWSSVVTDAEPSGGTEEDGSGFPSLPSPPMGATPSPELDAGTVATNAVRAADVEAEEYHSPVGANLAGAAAAAAETGRATREATQGATPSPSPQAAPPTLSLPQPEDVAQNKADAAGLADLHGAVFAAGGEYAVGDKAPIPPSPLSLSSPQPPSPFELSMEQPGVCNGSGGSSCGGADVGFETRADHPAAPPAHPESTGGANTEEAGAGTAASNGTVAPAAGGASGAGRALGSNSTPSSSATRVPDLEPTHATKDWGGAPACDDVEPVRSPAQRLPPPAGNEDGAPSTSGAGITSPSTLVVLMALPHDAGDSGDGGSKGDPHASTDTIPGAPQAQPPPESVPGVSIGRAARDFQLTKAPGSPQPSCEPAAPPSAQDNTDATPSPPAPEEFPSRPSFDDFVPSDATPVASPLAALPTPATAPPQSSPHPSNDDYPPQEANAVDSASSPPAPEEFPSRPSFDDYVPSDATPVASPLAALPTPATAPPQSSPHPSNDDYSPQEADAADSASSPPAPEEFPSRPSFDDHVPSDATPVASPLAALPTPATAPPQSSPHPSNDDYSPQGNDGSLPTSSADGSQRSSTTPSSPSTPTPLPLRSPPKAKRRPVSKATSSSLPSSLSSGPLRSALRGVGGAPLRKQRRVGFSNNAVVVSTPDYATSSQDVQAAARRLSPKPARRKAIPSPSSAEVSPPHQKRRAGAPRARKWDPDDDVRPQSVPYTPLRDVDHGLAPASELAFRRRLKGDTKYAPNTVYFPGETPDSRDDVLSWTTRYTINDNGELEAALPPRCRRIHTYGWQTEETSLLDLPAWDSDVEDPFSPEAEEVKPSHMHLPELQQE